MKKIISALAVVAVIAGAMSPVAAGAAGILNGVGNIGNLFTLDKLFNVGNDAKTNLGDLFILDQLFPQEETAVVAVTPVPLKEQLSGRILIQTEANGRAWYVSPQTKERYYLNGPETALAVMGQQSLGITNADFNSYGGTAPSRLAGKFLLKTEDNGRLYYVDPANKNIIPVIGKTGAFNLVEAKGLGITNTDIAKIPVAPGSVAVK